MVSAIRFFTQAYTAHLQSIREALQDFVEGYFDLSSGACLATALKIASYATLIIPVVVLAIKAYLQCSARNTHNRPAVIRFCANHPAFSGLLQKAQNLVHFENIGFRNGVNSRMFCIGSDAHGQNKLFIKSPMGKHIFTRQLRAKNEQLAFLISRRLQLGVVPPTIALEGYQDKIEAVLPKSMIKYAKVGCDPQTHKNSYAGVVLQEGVLLEKNQDNFDKTTLELDQVQKAIIFNLITGRIDAGRNNTVIAQCGKLMELDNEKLGQMSSDSWLLSEFAETTFSTKVISSFLSKPTDTVRGIFEEMEIFNFDQSTKTNITRNFDKIREFFSLYRGSQVKVKDLTGFLGAL